VTTADDIVQGGFDETQIASLVILSAKQKASKKKNAAFK
jgi:hypothetical protein